MKNFLIICILFFSFSNGFTQITKNPSPEAVKEKALKEEDGRLFFFTYPRSGTHWTLYVIKALTYRLTTKHLDPLGNRDPHQFGSDFSKPCVHPCHFYKENRLSKNNVPIFNLKNDKILLTIRHPLDCLIRDLHYVHSVPLNELSDYLRKHPFKLYGNLEFYDKWPENNRMIIYYEDLLDYPKREMKRLLNFLEESQNLLMPFLNNLEMHKNKCIAKYNHNHQQTGGSRTQGSTSVHHSEMLSDEQQNEIMNILHEQNPALFEKYLGRYKNEN